MDFPKVVLLSVAFGLTAPAFAAAQSYFYPSNGQDSARQGQDRTECNSWAMQQTGYGYASSAPPPSPPPPQGGVLRGAARGAAIGAVGGAIAGNAGRGAAIGAASGGLIGGMRRADQNAQYNQQQQQYNNQQQQSANAYNRALGACMQGRGYTVN